MAKKKTATKRKYKKCSKAQFNYIASHYHKTVLTCSFRIQYNSSVCKFVGVGVDNIANIQDLLTSCADWNTYKTLFLSYKITGMSVEFSPGPVIPAVVNATTDTGVFPVTSYSMNAVPAVALLSSTDAVDYAAIIESNKHALLSFTNKTKFYATFTGGIAGWFQTTSPNVQTGRLAVNTQSLPSGGEIFWQCVCNFYITYKITV